MVKGVKDHSCNADSIDLLNQVGVLGSHLGLNVITESSEPTDNVDLNNLPEFPKLLGHYKRWDILTGKLLVRLLK